MCIRDSISPVPHLRVPGVLVAIHAPAMRRSAADRYAWRPVKFAIAIHGTRGDIEPSGAVARELLRRGHEVRMAVPPNLVSFVASAGLPEPASYGVDSQQQLDADIFRDHLSLKNPVSVVRELRDYMTQGWQDTVSYTHLTLPTNREV